MKDSIAKKVIGYLSWKIHLINKSIKSNKIKIIPSFYLKIYIDIVSGKSHFPPVLMFHKVSSTHEGPMYVAPDVLKRFIEYLQKQGYSFLFETDYRLISGKAILFTFDDGYMDNYYELLPIVKKYKCKISVNIITDTIGMAEDKLKVEQIQEMIRSGLVDIESHTVSHRRLPLLTDDEIVSELRDSKNKIEELFKKHCTCVAYPYNDIDDRIAETASHYYQLGFGNRSGFMTIPRMSMKNLRTERELLEVIYLCLRKQKRRM